MNRRVMLQFSSAVIAASILCACRSIRSFPAFRYRLTLEVETPEGLRIGSSVIEVRWGAVDSSLGGASGEARGEAVAVDLPGGQTLFALLYGVAQPDWADYAMFSVIPLPRPNREQSSSDALEIGLKKIAANRKLLVLPRYLPPLFRPEGPRRSAYPLLARFGDIREPTSIAEVDADNLANSFGPGVRLKRITVQVTDDPVTRGIEKRLVWLPNVYKMHIGNDFHPAGIPVGDFQGLFSTMYR